MVNQCWIIISKVLRHSLKNNFIPDAQATIYENVIFKFISISLRGQWVKTVDIEAYMASYIPLYKVDAVVCPSRYWLI